MVEIRGLPESSPLACMTKITEGMDVTAHSDLLLEYRRHVTEMMFVERNHVCASASQTITASCRTRPRSWASPTSICRGSAPRSTSDASHRLFAIDHNRCILCLRCVRVCDEIEGAHTWDVMHRGLETGSRRTWGSRGRVHHLHQLREVRPGLPDRRALREGPGGRPCSKTKRPFLPWDEGRRRGAWL